MTVSQYQVQRIQASAEVQSNQPRRVDVCVANSYIRYPTDMFLPFLAFD